MKLEMPAVNISTRFAAVASTLVIVSALTIGAILFSTNAQILISKAETELSFDMKQAGADLRDSADNAHTKVAFLADLPQVRELADATYSRQRELLLKRQLTQIFASLASSSREVMQVRLIGAADGGRELVRVDRTANIVRGTSPADLQQKGDRPYVKNTLDAAPGVVLLSNIELNRERNQIQIPHVPVLRASTPVYSAAGEIFGVLVININMNEVMDRMRSRFPADVNLYLVNANGDYILHPDPSKTFGFEFGRPIKFVDEFPELASFMTGDKIDETLIRPIADRGTNIIHMSRETIDATRQHLYFVAAAMLPESSALVAGYERQIKIGLLTLVLALLGALAAIITSNWLVKPLRNLSKAAARLANGEDIDNLDIAVDRGDEVGDLARSFTVMAHKLRDRQTRLEEKRERLRAILDAAGTPIITIDKVGVIQSVNVATTTMLGFSSGELVGSNISMLMTPEDKARHDKYLANYQKTGRGGILGVGREVVAQAKDGTLIPIHLSVSQVRLKDRVLYTGVMTDLREQKKVNKLKDDFVSTVSHELRTPLTSIRGSLSLLKADMFGELPQKMVQMIDIAHVNAERLSHLVNDILDIEKIEAGKLTFSFEPLDLGAFLRRTVDANLGHAQSLGVLLKMKPCAEGLMLDADPDRLAQVVTNLISNAVKFTPKSGEVMVSANVGEQSVRIEIEDQGPGVPLDFQDKIFSKFAQADSSNTRAPGGTGLGLAISRAIVAAHGGQIGFRNMAGKGSIFHIELPRHQARDSHQDLDGVAGVVGAA